MEPCKICSRRCLQDTSTTYAEIGRHKKTLTEVRVFLEA
jgi:hypothetical protein